MADKADIKVSQLEQATDIQDNDLLMVVQDGISKKILRSDFEKDITDNIEKNSEDIETLNSKAFQYRDKLGTANLNEITEPGAYTQTEASNATLERNYPVAGQGGHLEVIRLNITSTLIQTYTLRNGSAQYIRTCYSGTWYGWAKSVGIQTYTSITQLGLTKTTNMDLATILEAMPDGSELIDSLTTTFSLSQFPSSKYGTAANYATIYIIKKERTRSFIDIYNTTSPAKKWFTICTITGTTTTIPEIKEVTTA